MPFEHHHGFRSGRYCLSVVVDDYNEPMYMLNSYYTVDMIYQRNVAWSIILYVILLYKFKDLGITDITCFF